MHIPSSLYSWTSEQSFEGMLDALVLVRSGFMRDFDSPSVSSNFWCMYPRSHFHATGIKKLFHFIALRTIIVIQVMLPTDPVQWAGRERAGFAQACGAKSNDILALACIYISVNTNVS